jgi:hypothetical protein
VHYNKNTNYKKYGEIEYGKPLIVFIETDPWLMVIGSDTPSFVLYDSGHLVYKYIEKNEAQHRYLKLTNNEMDDFIKFLNISDEVYDMDEFINIYKDDYVTDYPYNILYLNMDIKKRIVVYGDLRKYIGENVPKSFLEIYNKIINYRNIFAIEWFPPKIEIMFSEWSGAKNIRKWIEGYPDLKSDASWQHGKIYSVYLDIEKYSEFIDYYNLVYKNNEAVEINDKTMVLRYRLPFPIVNEPYSIYNSK